MKYKDELLWLPIEYPSDDEINDLINVEFSSPGTSNPEDNYDNEDDMNWFNAESDHDAMDLADFYDAHNNYIIGDGSYADEEGYRQIE